MIRINREFLDYVTRLKHSTLKNTILEKEAAIGQKIIEQQTRINTVYIIKSGLAKCYLTEDTGKDFIQEFFGEGEVFGEIEIFTKDFSFCAIEAITPMSYFTIDNKDFLGLIKNDSCFNLLVLNLMASKIRYTALRHSYNQSHPLESNLNRLIGQFPELQKKIPKNDIANYLGISIRSLNRVLKNLE
ncbi:Crp/Fnr family transcriptional regulator [Flagellimonas sp. HMM57]|uniref:Crp/Fnr family transcriptional regulator n=1 Tax=unclassified Flagellimonas TaxID=2644544 RepID=UPI0013D76F3D|nr:MULTISPECIES: Crp/Fnr family transcriptional regulator [unclassified Flagellimonas]UII77306.1 Crp/Fnr family transcriptional regulator [Flagellimonas sp. HMM57]